ncbi:MAG: putative toxin-antitoxin system toxin component, PIN family [Deferrisomatales bacterium]|nr:putative toxin-antitoxin system toxin component, PIN family [Deferrisomatales bacterium]
MNPAPRVVLGTNRVLSALVFPGGRVAGLRHAWQSGAFTPLVSHATAAELVRVLACPTFRLTTAEQQVLLADYLPHCATVKIPAHKPAVPACRDPFDRPFLLLAVAGKADALVTGDRSPLSLAGRLPYPILTAEAFLQTLPPAP